MPSSSSVPSAAGPEDEGDERQHRADDELVEEVGGHAHAAAEDPCDHGRRSNEHRGQRAP